MKIAISIDSACDMPQELKEKYNIFTMPYYVTLGDKEYIDGLKPLQLLQINLEHIFATFLKNMMK